MNGDSRGAIDRNTEAYFAAWTRSRPAANQALEEEIAHIADLVNSSRDRLPHGGAITAIANADGSVSLPGLDGEAAYHWLTDFLVETERVIERYAGTRTAETLLLQSRRDLACRLLEGTEEIDGVCPASLQTDTTFACAVAQFSAPGNTCLPDVAGPYEVPASDELAITIHVLRGLCAVHGSCGVQRRRLLFGGVPSLGLAPFPVARLLPHIEDRLAIHMKRAGEAGAPVFSRMGFDIPPLDIDRAGEEDPARLLWVAGRVKHEQVIAGNSPSDVRPFRVAWYDGRQLLDALELFAPAIETQWGMSPAEIVCAAIATGWLWGGAFLDPEDGPGLRYSAETKAVFSVNEAGLVDYLLRRVPAVARALGCAAAVGPADGVVQRFVGRFVSRPQIGTADLRSNSAVRLPSPIPFLFRAGDKLLCDFSLILQAFSSIVNWLDVHDLNVKKKGKQFEDHVRSLLVRGTSNLRVVPEMERRFFDGGREIGQADVVVAIEDTAFLIECKSRRAPLTDRCKTLAAARNHLRPVMDWAHQVQATAAFVARHPSGRKHRVPEQIRWIVPLVCSPMVEVAWQDDPSLFLVHEEVPISMTPREILRFIESGRWRHRTQVRQYLVQHPDALLAYGRLLAAEGRLDEAIEILERAASASPSDGVVLVELASLLSAVGRPEEASETCRKVLAIEPENVAVLNHFGVTLFEIGRYREAQEAYGIALRREPENDQILVHLANAQDAGGDADAAIQTYHRAIALAPNNPTAHYNLGFTLESTGDAQAAICAYREAVARDSNYLTAWNALGGLLMHVGDPDGAAEAYRRVVTLAPELKEVRSDLAAALQAGGREAEALCQIGTLHATNGRFPEAIEAFRKALSLDRLVPGASFDLGRALSASGDIQDAVIAYREALVLERDSWQVLCQLSEALRECGELEESDARLSEALGHLPDTPDARRSLAAAYNNLGNSFNERGRSSEAITLHLQAVTLFPSYAIGWFNLGNSYSSAQRDEEAIDAYGKAVELAPNYAEAWSNLGSRLYEHGRLGDAIRAYQWALQLLPDDVVTLGHLGQVYYRHGSFREAGALYVRAIDVAEKRFGRGYPHMASLRQLQSDLAKAMGLANQPLVERDR